MTRNHLCFRPKCVDSLSEMNNPTFVTTTLQKYKLLMNEPIMAKKNTKKQREAGGTLANTHDLVAIGLVEVVGVAESKVDEPGVKRTGGNRGPGPEIIDHISFGDPIGCGRRPNAVGVGLHQFFLCREAPVGLAVET